MGGLRIIIGKGIRHPTTIAIKVITCTYASVVACPCKMSITRDAHISQRVGWRETKGPAGG